MRGSKVIRSFFLGLSAWAVVAAASVEASFTDGAQDSGTLFPAPICDVEARVPALQKHLIQTHVPAWDGELPWPGIRGAWLNESRGIYLLVTARDLPELDLTYVKVVIRSVCSNQVLAEGARYLTEADGLRRYLWLPLRNHAQLSGRPLYVYLRGDSRAPEKLSSPPRIEVKILEREAAPVRDAFLGLKLLPQ